MQFRNKYLKNISFVCITIFMFVIPAHSALTVHIMHPWASDSSRLSAGLWIQSNATGWYPGAAMTREAGGWFTYTFADVDSSSNERFELVSYIPTSYNQYDSSIKYTETGVMLLRIKDFILLSPSKKEVWIYIETLTANPRIEVEPPKCKVVNFFN